MAKCKYCEEPHNETSLGQTLFHRLPLDGMYIKLWIEKDNMDEYVLVVDTPAENDYSKVNYCPMCGRELTNERAKRIDGA